MGITECEKDQGIFISDRLKWLNQVRHAASKANKVLGMLLKTFVNRESDLWKKLNTSLVRPHLEYAVQAWCPYQERDIQILERVQRRATKIPSCHKDLDYESRLRLWGLTTLEKRREKGEGRLDTNVQTCSWY